MQPDPAGMQPCGKRLFKFQSLSGPATSIVCDYTTQADSEPGTAETHTHTHRLTGVRVQLRVDNVDFSVLLGLFCRLGRPGAGDQVVGTPVPFQAHQVEGHGAELARASALQEHHLVVVGDISVGTDAQHLVSGEESAWVQLILRWLSQQPQDALSLLALQNT